MDDENERAARATKGSPFLNTAQAAFYNAAQGPCRNSARTARFIATISRSWTTGRKAARRPGNPMMVKTAPKRRPVMIGRPSLHLIGGRLRAHKTLAAAATGLGLIGFTRSPTYHPTASAPLRGEPVISCSSALQA
ncbi:hypothetical protein [Mesorhizobium sp. WSM2561]|uniref:hypothetical protein n=1 Tax=Mesorhizobium sp. WSM2561 TaxID=1040985 RepID=UPI0004B2C2AA|nr:hypothetical protein [Mesorhizobium sp. WSM2561]